MPILPLVAAFIIGLGGWHIFKLLEQRKLLLRASAWPKIEAEVVDSGCEVEYLGSGENKKTRRKRWANVQYKVDGQTYVASILDAHTPGAPGDEDMEKDLGWVSFVGNIAVSLLTDSPYPNGQKLQVHYDPEQKVVCMLKPEVSAVFYAPFTLCAAFMGFGLWLLFWAMHH